METTIEVVCGLWGGLEHATNLSLITIRWPFTLEELMQEGPFRLLSLGSHNDDLG